MFKKKFTLITVLLALVCSLCMAFTACTNNDNPNDTTDPKDNATYTGLFTYVRDADGTLYYGSLVLFEDGSFWYENDMLGNDYLGTYSYNSDKTKITLTGENLPDVDGTYDVEVKDGVVTIKNIMVLALSATEVYYENFTYDAVRTPPQKKPLSIKKFYKSDDVESYFEVQTEGKYYLIVEDPEILSSGTYTKTEANGKTTYTLTDTLNGQNATYTFEYTYADETYSNMLLKGTGIDAAGIAFTDKAEREALVTYRGTAVGTEANEATHNETVTLKCYSETEFEMEFTVMGANPTLVSGTYGYDQATQGMKYTATTDAAGGAAVAMVKSVTGTIGEGNKVTITVTICLEALGYEYTATLNEVAAEREVQATFRGTVTHGEGDAATTETVTVKFFKDSTDFEIEFTTWGGYPATATGTYANDYATMTIAFTVTDGIGKDYITAISGSIDPTTYATTINVTIANAQAFLEYSVELQMVIE